ncbi:hypothetical protein [uncultured Hyphomonas sp.]|uniref:hypothetical protein n=1 Tax=uncultured Hyphomonas sp. TaxID=225298 RepID=UPI002AAB4CB5|nr:hypothetical protein [uncultured Hyphomonas sp.]
MYRLTDDLWTGSHIGPASPGRGGRFMDAADNRPKTDGSGKDAEETPFLYRRRRRRMRRAA